MTSSGGRYVLVTHTFRAGDRVEYRHLTSHGTGVVSKRGSMKDDEEFVEILIKGEPHLIPRNTDDCTLISRKQIRRRHVK